LSSNQNLKEHFYTHSREKPLECPFPGCHKVFRQSSQLSTHKKWHNESSEVFRGSSEAGLKTFIKQLSQAVDFTVIDHDEGDSSLNCFNIPKIFNPVELFYKL
jgi:hypothetical protein